MHIARKRAPPARHPHIARARAHRGRGRERREADEEAGRVEEEPRYRFRETRGEDVGDEADGGGERVPPEEEIKTWVLRVCWSGGQGGVFFGVRDEAVASEGQLEEFAEAERGAGYAEVDG